MLLSWCRPSSCTWPLSFSPRSGGGEHGYVAYPVPNDLAGSWETCRSFCIEASFRYVVSGQRCMAVPSSTGACLVYALCLTQEPRLLLTDPVGIDYVMRKRVYAFPKPRLLQRMIGGIMGEGLLVAEGETHKRQKRAIQPGFSLRAIRRLMPVFQRHARLLHDYYETLTIKENVLVDVYALFGAAAMDVVGEGALGVDLGILASMQANPDGEAYAAHPLTASLDRALKMASKPSLVSMWLDMATTYFPVLERIPMGISSPAFRKEARVIVDVASGIVSNAKARIERECTTEEYPDILASLLRANANTTQAKGEKTCLLDRTTLTDAELTAQVSTFIFAGHETTATQLSWLFLLLAQNSACQSKLRADIRSKRMEVGLPPKRLAQDAGSEELSQDDLDAIPYLDWCIRESLRLHTAIHSTSRMATELEQIPLSTGRHVLVDKGMLILIPLTSISTSADLWGAHPERFCPERWSEPMSGPKKYPAYYSWSFLMGPRACIGSAFGTSLC